MNNEQIEAAARRLCEIRDQDPDDSHPTMARPFDTALDIARREVVAFYQVARATHFAVTGEDLPE